jgi:hypothetical protein
MKITQALIDWTIEQLQNNHGSFHHSLYTAWKNGTETNRMRIIGAFPHCFPSELVDDIYEECVKEMLKAS